MIDPREEPTLGERGSLGLFSFVHELSVELHDLRTLVSDLPEQFAASAARFLAEPVEGLDIQAIDL